MAFKDITETMYNESILVTYLDKSHRYQARNRVNWDLPVDNPKAWGKALFPSGCTTILGNTLEKKGLQRYPLTKALMYLFQFYEFTDDAGEKKMGYSKKGFGSMWDTETDTIRPLNRDEALDVISYGSKADLRWTQKGADIGSVVHDAIEHYISGHDFDIETQYRLSMEAAEYESERAKEQAKEEFDADVEQAKKAFIRFTEWWNEVKPELVGTEELIYSKQHNICGTFDGLIRLDGKLILADWKTSNASQSKDACMPEGVNYQYFLQSAIYAMAYMEMHTPHDKNGAIIGECPPEFKVDDLLIVSCRKDGGFTPIFASELGLTVEQCINWARAVIVCKRMMEVTKKALWEHGVASGAVIEKIKKGTK